jgi:uncharacterized protein
MEIRDPIHGLISYDSTEEQIINTRVFQRLRNIKQLALASYVYPGAHHSRFEHCIGTMHLAGKVANSTGVKLDKELVRITRLAGLLHDIGHGPFSHVSEQILEKYSKIEAQKYSADNAHELMSIMLILKHPEIQRILGEDNTKVAELLQKGKRSIAKDIVSGPLDVDKLDYLQRDSYFAGVRYGIFDVEKVIESFSPVAIGSDITTLGINEEGIHAVEQLLLAKYHMNAQVYRHRIRRITDAMLVRGIELAYQEGLTELKEIFEVRDSDEFVQNYTKYNDDVLTRIILTKSKGPANEYFRRIVDRSLMKEVFSVNIDISVFSDPVVITNISNLTNDQTDTIAKEASKLYSTKDNEIPEKMIIIDKQTISNPTFKSPGVKIDSDTIMVQTKQGRGSFPQVSDIFRNAGVDPKKNLLSIYLPLDWIVQQKDRLAYVSERKSHMKEIIEGIVK